MPAWGSVVTLQHIVLCESLGEVVWSDADWGFSQNQYTSGIFLV